MTDNTTESWTVFFFFSFALFTNYACVLSPSTLRPSPSGLGSKHLYLLCFHSRTGSASNTLLPRILFLCKALWTRFWLNPILCCSLFFFSEAPCSQNLTGYPVLGLW